MVVGCCISRMINKLKTLSEITVLNTVQFNVIKNRKNFAKCKSKVLERCIISCLTYATETLAMAKKDLQRLQKHKAMKRRMLPVRTELEALLKENEYVSKD